MFNVRCPKSEVRRFTPEGTPAPAWVPSSYNYFSYNSKYPKANLLNDSQQRSLLPSI
jgi:hypothetical protein